MNRKMTVIQDIAGVGGISMVSAIPVLTYLGISPLPYPTQILTSHHGYEGCSSFWDINSIKKGLEQQNKINQRGDSLYVGYLGIPDFGKEVIQYKEKNKQIPLYLDPVLGDKGKLYKGYGEEMVNVMRNLCRYSQVATPNLTEIQLLLNKDTLQQETTKEELLSWCKEYQQTFKGNLVITSGITKEKSYICVGEEGKEGRLIEYDPYPYHFAGTGDLFASCLFGLLEKGISLVNSVKGAKAFVEKTIEKTIETKGETLEGKEGVLLGASLNLLGEILTQEGINLE